MVGGRRREVPVAAVGAVCLGQLVALRVAVEIRGDDVGKRCGSRAVRVAVRWQPPAREGHRRTTHNSRTWNFVKATPVTTPSASSKRSSRSRTHRTSSQITRSHWTGSRVYGVSQCPNSVVHTPVACAAAVNPCARRSHPSSQAMRPATTTPPAVASTTGTRNAISEPGAAASVNAASAGASGG